MTETVIVHRMASIDRVISIVLVCAVIGYVIFELSRDRQRLPRANESRREISQ